jgi:hypothetical protein
VRILVTGSRDWDDADKISEVLWQAVMLKPPPYTLVTGACPTGADFIAESLAVLTNNRHPHTWVIERHPAQWGVHGKRAGFVRNAEMVELGADVCVAFIKNNSRGATMTADLAEKAGIPTKRYHA